MNPPPSTAYGWLMLAGIFVSITLWSRVAKRNSRLVLIYVAALAGAFLGAKLVYLGAEGWLHWHDEHRWLILATGKSITGALLGGYAGVEIAKHFLDYPGATGDWFAIIAPVGIMLGRVGCLLHGCCLGRVCTPAWFTLNDAAGVARWPAVPVEFLFNALALGVNLLLRQRKLFPGQLFHLYLMAYRPVSIPARVLARNTADHRRFFRLSNRLAGPGGVGCHRLCPAPTNDYAVHLLKRARR